MVDRSKRGSAFFRGNDGMRRTDDELELAKQKAEQRKAAGNMPFRFRVPVGETRQIIICDDKPDFFLYEHSLKDAEGNWGKLFTGCVKTFDNCPVCESSGKESYYAMILTIIDLTPFTLRDGTEIEFSRKLLVVKPAQQKKFLRFFNKEGSLRGALFDMTRDGDKDSSIGNDIDFVEFVDEEEMETYTRSWKDKDGKKHTEDCSEPYVYEDMFDEPSVEKLRAIVGGAPNPGSREHDERELGGNRRGGTARRGAADSDDKPARGARRGGKAKDDDWEKDDEDLPFDPDEKPARGRRGRTAEPEDEKPAPRTAARRGRAVGPEDEPEDEPEERQPARSRRGRTVEPDDEPEAKPSGREARRARR